MLLRRIRPAIRRQPPLGPARYLAHFATSVGADVPSADAGPDPSRRVISDRAFASDQSVAPPAGPRIKASQTALYCRFLLSTQGSSPAVTVRDHSGASLPGGQMRGRGAHRWAKVGGRAPS